MSDKTVAGVPQNNMDIVGFESSYDLYNVTDLNPYKLPLEELFGLSKSESDYRIKKLIGDGTYSRVYLAKSRKTEKLVALKVLKNMNMASTLSVDAFREITILKSLDHESIVKVHDVIVADESSSTCLVLDFYPISLETYIETFKGQIAPTQIKCILKQMLSGVSYLHRNYVMHRDLKPSNLMITEKGELKIVDFGLSRRFSYLSLPTSPNVMTRWYQAPELLLEAPSYGPEIDVWSVGCILGELYQKKPLLRGESEIQQINLIIDLIGTPSEKSWPNFKHCRVFKNLKLKSQPANRIGDKCHELGCTDALELMSGIFVYNPADRLKAEDGLELDWFHKAPFPAKTIEFSSEILSNMQKFSSHTH